MFQVPKRVHASDLPTWRFLRTNVKRLGTMQWDRFCWGSAWIHGTACQDTRHKICCLEDFLQLCVKALPIYIRQCDCCRYRQFFRREYTIFQGVLYWSENILRAFQSIPLIFLGVWSQHVNAHATDALSIRSNLSIFLPSVIGVVKEIERRCELYYSSAIRMSAQATPLFTILSQQLGRFDFRTLQRRWTTLVVVGP